jgi:hypothetical protein
VIIFAVDSASHREYFFAKGLVGCLLGDFFCYFELANGTKQRTFPPTVFTQQLEAKKKKKKKKKDVANCPALLAK